MTQAWRQPGSSFKPFIYSASLEKGFIAGHRDQRRAGRVRRRRRPAARRWEPKNYDGKFEGPMRMRTALAKSKNMVSIRILRDDRRRSTRRNTSTRFGFDAEKHPPYLTMALGAGSVTPLQMARRLRGVRQRRLPRAARTSSRRSTDADGKVLVAGQARQRAGDESQRVIDARNAFIMDSMMQDVVALRHRRAAPRVLEPHRPRRQDRHHQRFDRRLVRRLPAEPRRHRLDRLRPAEEPGQQRNRRRRSRCRSGSATCKRR